MKISDHILQGDNVSQMTTPNLGGTFADGQPDSIVIHFTAGRSAKSSATWLCNPEAKASAHIVLGNEGEIYQLAPLNVITWHAGRSQWQGRSGFNKYSIGIEIDNPGRLEKRQSGFYTWYGHLVPDDRVVEAVHRNESDPTFWCAYSEEQIAKTEELCSLLLKSYAIREILGHEEISPGRKQDPGPAFPLDKLRNRLLYNDRSEDEPEVQFGDRGLVDANLLNIRKAPGKESPTLGEPLKRGTSVTILGQQGDWLRVSVETEGWVSKKFIKSIENG